MNDPFLESTTASKPAQDNLWALQLLALWGLAAILLSGVGYFLVTMVRIFWFP